MSRDVLRGTQRDIADYLGTLEEDGYHVEHGGSGHLKVFAPGDGHLVASASGTPGNPYRTLKNLRSDVRRWQRENGLLPDGQDDEPGPAKPKKRRQPDGMSGFTIPGHWLEEDRPPMRSDSAPPSAFPLAAVARIIRLPDQVQEEEVTPRRRSWTDAEKAALIARYQETPHAERGPFLIEHDISVQYITNWKGHLTEKGWSIPDVPEVERVIPVPGEETIVEKVARLAGERDEIQARRKDLAARLDHAETDLRKVREELKTAVAELTAEDDE
jgi:hypothetical protein